MNHRDNPLQEKPAPLVINRICPICHHPQAEKLWAEERMIGRGERFDYGRCLNCGAITILEVPSAIADFYPSNYYSFQSSKPKRTLRGWSRSLAIARNQSVIFGTGGLGGFLARQRGSFAASEVGKWLKHSPVRSFSARVLDAGCGNGARLCRMHEVGYSHLVGVDPFIESDRSICAGLTIRKQHIHEVSDGPYDLIMLHHSLEHMDNHQGVLAEIHRLLSPHGACLIRIPIASPRLLERYGNCWVEWDAPRHLILHTASSFQRIVSQAGFQIVRCDHDSDRFVHWASQLYLRGISLIDPSTGSFRNPTDYFSTSELEHCDELANQDNRLQQASRAAFWLMKDTSK